MLLLLLLLLLLRVTDCLERYTERKPPGRLEKIVSLCQWGAKIQFEVK